MEVDAEEIAKEFGLDTTLANFKLINQVISAPRNDIFLTYCAKALTREEVLIMITLLQHWLKSHSKNHLQALRKNMSAKKIPRIPSYAQVLDWFCVLMDSHYTDLILSTEYHTSLTGIQSIIQEQIQFCDKVESIQGYLSHYVTKKKIPVATIPDYSIEVIDL